MAINIGPRIGIEGESEFRKQVKGITSEIKALDAEMKKVESSFDKNTSAQEKNAQKTEVLTQKKKALESAVEKLRQGVDKATEKYGANSEVTQRWKQQLASAEAELNAVNTELSNLTPAKAWGETFDEIGSKMQTVGNKMKDIGKTMSVAVTVPLVGIGTKAVKSFADVDKTMQLARKTMGATAEEAELLDDAMKDAAANSTFGMTDAANASLNFARAGLSAQEAADALAPAMNLAAGEGGNLDTVSAGLVATINGFGGSFSEATAYADVFANACNNSALDIDSLSDAMSIAAPIFSAAGYSVNDAALYMGVMANAGIDANTAATSLKTGFARLVKPTDEAETALENLGISVVNADGSMKDSVTIQEDLHNAFSGLSESEQIAAASAIFGKNQMSNWLALINTAPEEVQSLSTALETEGTTAEMAETMMGGFGGSLEKLKSSIDVAATSLGEALAPTISVIADKVQAAVDWFNSLDESQQQMIATVGLAVAALGPALMIGGTIIHTIGGIVGGIGNVIPLVSNLGPMVTKLTGIIGGLNPTMLLVAGGIAAAVAAGVAIYQNWDTIKEKAGQLKDALSEKFSAMKDKMTQTWDTIKEKGTVVMDTVSDITKTALSDMQREFEAKGGGIEGAQAAMMAGLNSIYTQGFNKIDTLTGGKLSKIKSLFSTTFTNAKSIVSDALGRIKSAFANSTFKFPSIKLPHFSWSWTDIAGLVKIPKISISWYAKAMDNGMILDSPTIFGMQNGKLLGGGEAGSETVVGTSSLMSMIKTAVVDAVGYGSTTNYGGVNINVYGAPGQDVSDLAQAVKEVLVADIVNGEAAWA